MWRVPKRKKKFIPKTTSLHFKGCCSVSPNPQVQRLLSIPLCFFCQSREVFYLRIHITCIYFGLFPFGFSAIESVYMQWSGSFVTLGASLENDLPRGDPQTVVDLPKSPFVSILCTVHIQGFESIEDIIDEVLLQVQQVD